MLVLKVSVGYEVFLFILIPKIILVVIIKVSFHPNHKSMSLLLHNYSLLHTLMILFPVLVFFQFLYEWKSLYLSTTPGNAVDFFDSSTHRCQGMGVITPSCAMMSVYWKYNSLLYLVASETSSIFWRSGLPYFWTSRRIWVPSNNR